MTLQKRKGVAGTGLEHPGLALEHLPQELGGPCAWSFVVVGVGKRLEPRGGLRGAAHAHLWALGRRDVFGWWSSGQSLLFCLCLSLNTPSLSTLGIQEKYLASSEQTTEQEAMQL